MPMTGDFSKLDHLIARMGRARTEIPRALAHNSVYEVRALVQESFANRATPEGEAWAPTKKGDGPPLKDLDKSLRFAAEGARVRVSSTKGYAIFHVTGTRRMLARSFLPAGRLPSGWGARLRPATTKQIRDLLGGF